MIQRYTRKEMGEIWLPEVRFEKMLEVEIAVAHVQAEMGIIPQVAARAIAKKAKFSLKEIEKTEAITKHDVIAFVSSVAASVGEHGRYVHYALTSSDVLDTALSLQLRSAGEVLKQNIKTLELALEKQLKKHAGTICAGRTHGMHAEPTTFGMKLAGFLSELNRNAQRLDEAIAQVSICKLSGAVGTYSASSIKFEESVAKLLRLEPERIATQVVPRDRHAQVISCLALLTSGLERLAIELRHLQRTEVSEVIEAFTPGQKGSSAMPHKKNPISAENISGLARLVRGYQLAAFENIALWHERDISHSSVERVIFADAFIVSDYAVDRMRQLVEGLYVDADRMRENMNLSQGQMLSSHLLLALVEKGLSREEAYSMVQTLSHSLRSGESLRDRALNDPQILKRMSLKEIDAVFSGDRHLRSIQKLLKDRGFLKGAKS